MAEKTRFIYGFSDILVKNESITEKEAHDLERLFKESSRDEFIYFVQDEGLIEKEALLKALKEYYRTESFDVEGYFFDNFLLRKFPKGFLLRRGVIPLRVDGNMLVLVASNPDDSELPILVNQYVSYDIKFMVGIKNDIIDAVEEFYDESLTAGYEEQEESDELSDDVTEIIQGDDE